MEGGAPADRADPAVADDGGTGGPGLLPVPGLPAPFLSYEGASLVTAFLALALLARISHEERT